MSQLQIFLILYETDDLTYRFFFAFAADCLDVATEIDLLLI